MIRCLQTLFWTACCVVAVFSLLPAERLPAGFDWWDKAQHALAFWLLGSIGQQAYYARPARVFLGLLAFGLLIEIAQATSGWRYGDWQDWVADAVGVGAAYATRLILQRFLSKRLWSNLYGTSS